MARSAGSKPDDTCLLDDDSHVRVDAPGDVYAAPATPFRQAINRATFQMPNRDRRAAAHSCGRGSAPAPQVVGRAVTTASAASPKLPRALCCRERGAKVERPRLYSDEPQPLRQQAKRSGQFDGMGYAEPCDRSAGGSRRSGAQPRCRTCTWPGVAARVGQHHPGEAELRDVGRHLGPDRVVAAGTVLDADHEGSHTPPQR
jgi:hypothetical protein